jgi:uncharacterized cupin superfamily protein
MPNFETPDFDQSREHDGFSHTRARIGRQAGSDRLGASVYELPPGKAAYPYHWHVGDEEMLFVLAGRPTLRTPAGMRELEQGEVVSFRRGEEGAHQLLNRTEQPVRFLTVSTEGDTDLVVYPDSDKLGAYGRKPDGGGGLLALFRRGDAVDYFEGESAPD